MWAKAQYISIVLSKVIVVTDDDNDNRPIDTIVKPVFFLNRGVSKRGDFIESTKINFHRKL